MTMTPLRNSALATAIAVLLAAAIAFLSLKVNDQRQWQKEFDAVASRKSGDRTALLLNDVARLVDDVRPKSSQRAAARDSLRRIFSEHVSSGAIAVKIDGRLPIDQPAITKRTSPAFVVKPRKTTLEVDVASVEFAQALKGMRFGTIDLQRSGDRRFVGDVDFSTVAEPQSITFLPQRADLEARSREIAFVVDEEPPVIQLTIDGQQPTPGTPFVADCTLPIRLKIEDNTGLGQGTVETRRGDAVDFSNRISKRSPFIEFTSIDTQKPGRIDVVVTVGDVAGNTSEARWTIDRLEPKHPELESWTLNTSKGTIDLLRSKIAYVTSEALDFAFSIRPASKTELALAIGERGRAKSEQRVEARSESTFAKQYTLASGISAFEIELRSTLASTKDVGVIGRAEVVVDKEGPRIAVLDGAEQSLDPTAVKAKKGSEIIVVVVDDQGLDADSVKVDGGQGGEVREVARRADLCRFSVNVNDGTSIKVTAKDVAGNETQRAIPVDVVADSTGPGFSVKFRDRLLADAAPLFFGATPRLEVSITDQNGVKEAPTVRYIDKAVQPASIDPIASSAGEMKVAFDAAGEFDLTVRDTFGNPSTRRYRIEILDRRRFRVEDAKGRMFAAGETLTLAKSPERLRFGFADAYPGLTVGVRANRTSDGASVDIAITDGKFIVLEPSVVEKSPLELTFFVDAVDGRVDLSKLTVAIAAPKPSEGESQDSRPTSSPRESDSVRFLRGRSDKISTTRGVENSDVATSAVFLFAPPTVVKQGDRPLVRLGSTYA